MHLKQDEDEEDFAEEDEEDAKLGTAALLQHPTEDDEEGEDYEADEVCVCACVCTCSAIQHVVAHLFLRSSIIDEVPDGQSPPSLMYGSVYFTTRRQCFS
jgi:hypothetical protein